jgi:hypothetical protein
MPKISVRFGPSKFKELLLYVAEKSVDDRNFGATKLNKILYFSDFLAYGEFGEAITGVKYQRLNFGPAPVPLLPVEAELEREGAAQIVEVPQFNWTQKRLIAKRRPDLSVFSAAEIALVDDVMDSLRKLDASAVSALSHLERSWQIVGDREEIPYEYAFLSSERMTPTDVARARAVAAELGLESAQ